MESSTINEKTDVKILEEEIVASMRKEIVPAPVLKEDDVLPKLKKEVLPNLNDEILSPNLKEEIQQNLKEGTHYQSNSTKEALPKLKKDILPSPALTEEIGTNAKVEDKGLMQSSLNPAEEMNFPLENQAKGGGKDVIKYDDASLETARRYNIPVEFTQWNCPKRQPRQTTPISGSTTVTDDGSLNQQGNLKPKSGSSSKIDVGEKSKSGSSSKIDVGEKPKSVSSSKIDVGEKPKSGSSSKIDVGEKSKSGSSSKIDVGEKPKSVSSSKVAVGEDEKKKSKEPYCCPNQVLRLLADHDYTFRQEEWKLKGKLQGHHPERTHLVLIVAEKYGKGELTGMGMGQHYRLAENAACLDLCEQLEMEHHLVLPKSDIYPDLRLSPGVLTALRTECNMRKLPNPSFNQHKGRSAHGSLRTCSALVAQITKHGRGMNDHIAKLDAAYKMYEAITGKEFPLVEIIKGKQCSGEFHRYNQTSNREFRMTQLRIPNPGLIPSGFRASLQAQASAPRLPKDDVAKKVQAVKAALVVPPEELQLTKTAKLSDDVKNKGSEKATKLRLEQLSSPLSQTTAASPAGDRVDQSQSRSRKNEFVVVGSTKNDVITSDLPAIRETTYYYRDEFYPRMSSDFDFEASQDLIPLAITSLVVLGIIVAMMVEYYIVKM